jgi:hypothetical protein
MNVFNAIILNILTLIKNHVINALKTKSLICKIKNAKNVHRTDPYLINNQEHAANANSICIGTVKLIIARLVRSDKFTIKYHSNALARMGFIEISKEFVFIVPTHFILITIA